MKTKIVEFPLPFRPQIGVPVMNDMAEEVGTVISVTPKPGLDDLGNRQYQVKAQVREDAGQSSFQVFEPLFTR